MSYCLLIDTERVTGSRFQVEILCSQQFNSDAFIDIVTFSLFIFLTNICFFFQKNFLNSTAQIVTASIRDRLIEVQQNATTIVTHMKTLLTNLYQTSM